MDETERPDAPAQDAPEAPTADAPWGVNPRTGRPYKRDPALFAHLRGQPRGSASKRPRRSRRAPTPSGPTSPAPSTRPAPAGGKRPAYGKRVAELGKIGMVLVPDPVDREILAMQLAQLAPIVDQLCAESPALATFLDRYLMKLAGGAKVDLAVWAATTGGLLAMNHGVHHPLLVAFLGAGLQTARERAAATARAAEQFRADLAADIRLDAQLGDARQDQVPADDGARPPDSVPVILGY